MKRVTAVKKTREKWHPVERATITLLQAIIERSGWLATMTDDEIKRKLREECPGLEDRLIDRALSQSADDGGPILTRS